MPAARGRMLPVVFAALAGVSGAVAAEWDYIASGSGRYAGRSTGVLDAEGTSALVFMCNMSAPGAINIELAVPGPATAIAQPLPVTIEVGEDRYEIDAISAGEGDVEVAMTWGRHAAVMAAARRVYETTETVRAVMGDAQYAFSGAGGSQNFAQMLEACGGGR